MLVVTRMALRWRGAMAVGLSSSSLPPFVPPSWKADACGVIMAGLRQRHHSTLSDGDHTPQQKGVASGESIPSSPSVTGGCGTPMENPISTPSDEEALGNLLEEILVVLSRPVPIGALFRALSSTSKKTLAKNKVPLEQLLLRYPEHFAVYQQGSLRNRTILCSPPHLVPANVRPMINTKPPPETAAPSLSSSSPSSSGDINSRILQHDPFAEKQQRITTVLQYIPNEWSPFTELGIPEEVRVNCMGKPGVKAIQFFEKYPQYFEVRQQSQAEHTFYVRRSLALQRSLDKSF